jgi:hypothetical protein
MRKSPYFAYSPENNISCMTVFRNPVDRVVSCYYFRFKPKAQLSKLSPDELVNVLVHEYSQYGEGCNNEPVRVLSGYDVEHELNSPDTPAGWDGIVRASVQHMKQCVVFLSEEMHSCHTRVLFKHHFPWLNFTAKRANVNNGRPKNAPLPPESIRVIESLNKPELSLYALAQEQYASQIKELERLGQLKACQQSA